MKIAFWVAVSLVIYTYFGYPCVLWVYARIRPRRLLKQGIFPVVSRSIAETTRRRRSGRSHNIRMPCSAARPHDSVVARRAAHEDRFLGRGVSRDLHLLWLSVCALGLRADPASPPPETGDFPRRLEIYRRDDPAPAIREIAQYSHALLRGAAARFSRSPASGA